MRILRAFWARLREFHANHAQLVERHLLVNEPWEEEFLHWSRSGLLHGSYVPPRDGWCPGDGG